MYSGTLPPTALCVCLRCHSQKGVVYKGSWGKTDCTCTCSLAFKGGLARSPQAETNRKNDDKERMKKMGEFPALSFDQVKNQALGFVYGLGVTVVLAVAADLSGLTSFQNLSLVGMGLTALRSTASFVTLFFTQRNSGGR